jgi:glycosyltransferase involved in cell wall biosynthesis
MIQPLISVIIPVYNQEKYCGQAIQSVLNQSYDNFELIVIDDGSTDSSHSIAHGLCSGHPNATVIKQENLGPSEAINTGLKVAKGEFIALCGGDDICQSNRLKIQSEILINSSFDIVFSEPYLIDQNGDLLEDGHFPIFFNIPKDFKTQPFRSLFFNGNFLCAPSAIFKASLVKEIGMFNPDLIQLQDYDFWMRALGQDKKILLSGERVIFYRRHTNNLSSHKNNYLLNGEYGYIFSQILDGAKTDLLRKTVDKYRFKIRFLSVF